MKSSQSADRVVKNTSVLYFKLVITLLVGLYTTRLVLNALGIEDYGIYSLVAGVISLLSFLNVAMTISTQRYMSYYLGTGQLDKIRIVFNTSFILHLIIGVLVVIILEVAGIFLFNSILSIPEVRLKIAISVYHFMVLSTFLSIISVPYDAIINAKENMVIIAIIDIIIAFLRLGIAVYITFTLLDRLLLYGLLIGVTAAISLLFKRYFCTKNYNESILHVRKYYKPNMFREMFSFSSWNFFGAISVLVKNQGVAMILNVFLGATINASYGISSQVNSQLQMFSASIIKAINPQIVKSEGGGHRERMLKLSMIASKFSFLLMSFFSIPLLIEMEFVLFIWLKTVPDFTVAFCRLFLLASLIGQLTVGIQIAIQSVGRIRLYQIGISSILIMTLPLAYVLLKSEFSPPTVLLGSMVIEVFALIFRIFAARKLTKLNVGVYFANVLLRPIILFLVVFVISLIPSMFINQGWLRLFTTICMSSVFFVIAAILFGLTKYEKEILSSLFVKNFAVVGPIISKLKFGK